MTLDERSGFIGLVTATAESKAPPGALAKADNVVIRKPGLIEMRDGTADYATITAASGKIAHRLIPYAPSNVLVWDNNSDVTGYRDVTNNAAITYFDASDGVNAAAAPELFRTDLIGSAAARGNLYLAHQGGVISWDGSGTAYPSGIAICGRPTTPFVAGAGTAVANNTQVNYRVVFKRTDSNGVVIRSRPSGAVNLQNTAGSTQNVTLTIAGYVLSSDWGTNQIDGFEVYRTRGFPTTSTIDEEYALVLSYDRSVPTYVQVTDSVPDSARGQALYTSPSREGAEGANDLPPACGCMALFKGAVFFGNVKGRKRRALSFTWGGNVSGSATGVGYRIVTGDVTNGSNQILNLSSVVGIQKGQVPNVQEDTHVTAISGTTVTLSGNFTGVTAVGATIYFYDSVGVNGAYTYAYQPGLNSTSTLMSVGLYAVTPALAGYTNTFVYESIAAGDNAVLSLKATHGDEYFPQIPLYDATADDGDQDVWPHGLMWSKTDEPEHVPLKNYAFVGDKNGEILALEPTRDALFIFKSDGIYRLTGVNGQWRIDPFDMTTRCVLPSSVVGLNNRIYALTNKGFVVVSSDGVQVISAPIDDVVKPLVYALQSAGSPYRVKAYGSVSMGWAATANEIDGEYVCMVGSYGQDASAANPNKMLVFNERTKSWTQWSIPSYVSAYPSCLAWDPKRSRLLYGQYYAPATIRSFAPVGTALGSTGAASRAWRCDGSTQITVTANAGGTLTFNPATQFAATDYLIDSDGTAYDIIAVPSTVQITAPGVSTTGVKLVVRPISCRVQPRGFVSPVSSLKHWSQVSCTFLEMVGTVDAAIECASSVELTPSFVSTSFDTTELLGVTAYEYGAILKTIVPASAARGWIMRSAVTWKSVYGSVAIEAIFADETMCAPGRGNLAVAT